MGDLFDAVSLAASLGRDSDAAEALEAIIAGGADLQAASAAFAQPDFLWQRRPLARLLAHAVAELAKAKANRELLSCPTVVQRLAGMLEEGQADAEAVALGCRALGNLCFENDEARRLVLEQDGLDKVLGVLRTEAHRTDPKLMATASGFLLNLIHSRIHSVERRYEDDILQVFADIHDARIDSFHNWRDCFMHLLLAMNVLIENRLEMQVGEDILRRLIKILEVSDNLEISGLCLEFFHTFAEIDDKNKLTLSRAGLYELLYALLEQYKSFVENDDQRAILKCACDLIVIILTGDESMIYLYDNGKGAVLRNMVSWLDSDDEDFLISGILAMGNFARSDSHCIQMVESGISRKLLDLLRKHNTEDSNVRIQHALLSAIKNILILPQNKPKLVEDKLVDIIYPMLKFAKPPVVFKLLGTMRMAIDGQESISRQLLGRKELIRMLCDFCSTSDHPGTQSEAFRLIAWLVRNCNSPEARRGLLGVEQCLGCISKVMPSTPYPIMLNEALASIRLVCEACLEQPSEGKQVAKAGTDGTEEKTTPTTTNAELLRRNLADGGVFDHLGFLLRKKVAKADAEAVDNILGLLEMLAKTSCLANEMKKSDVPDAVREMLDKEESKHLAARLEGLHARLEAA